MLPRFIRWKEQPLVGGLVQKMMIASRSVPALLHLVKGHFIKDVAFNSVFPTLVPWGLVPTKGASINDVFGSLFSSYFENIYNDTIHIVAEGGSL